MAVNTVSFKIRFELLLLAVGLIWLQVHLPDAFGAETVKTPTKCRLKNSSDGLTANCQHLGLTEVPQDLPQGVTVLDLSVNELTVLHNSSFQDVQNVTFLSLHINRISSIHSRTFWKLTKLSFLILNGNNLESISPKIFLKNMLLTQLLLNDNHLKSVPHEAFSNIPNLSNVVLGGNKIKSINFEGCSQWSHLEEIYLDQNELEEIQQEYFLPLQNTTIGSLTLTANKIQILQPQCFLHLSFIQEILLEGNPINSFDIQPFLGMTYIEHLSLFGCQIHDLLPPDFASNLSVIYPTIRTLTLSYNMIETVQEGALWGFTKLEVLSLSLNKLNILTNQSFCRLESLTELDISHNKLTSFTKGTFACLLSLKRLNASGNLLQTLSPGSFYGMSSILTISLSSNIIEALNNDQQLWTIKTLCMLDISNNALKGVSKGRFNGLTNLEALNISGNNINYYSYTAFTGLLNLKELYLKNERAAFLQNSFCQLHTLLFLDLSNAPIQVSPTSTEQFFNMSSLRELRMEKAQLKDTDLYDKDKHQSLFTGLFSLRTLRIKDNYLHDLDVRIFQNLSQLVHLDMSNSRIHTLRSGLFSPLPSLRYLYIGENNLVEVPGDIFNGLFRLNVLTFQNNILSSLDPKTFAQTLRLTDLYLPGNQISTIKPGTVLPGNTSLRLDISNNPFSCTCSLAWFRQWLDSADIDVKHADQTLCSGTSLKGLSKQPILSFHPEDHCGVNIFLIAGINIIYGDRDLHLGMFYINAINDALDNSFKTVLLISNQSISDAWCMTKLRMALEHLNDTGLDKIILIFLEDIEDENLPYLVRLFMSRNKPYMLWTDDEDGQELFWAQFERSMRANKAINNAIPL
eukprot:XP_011675464.1 PREDICTED: slit homolog 3 protein-like [Strongylocentrotus purpuratus]